MARKFYFNTKTQQVEQGRQSPGHLRMGPYATYEEAAAALETAHEHSAAWDEEDRAWKEEWDPPEDEDSDEPLSDGE